MTARNWKRHPAIAPLRRLARAVDQAERRGELRLATRTFQFCRPGEDGARRLWRDDAGRVVKYLRQVGGAETSLTFEQYYDPDGRLRYAFIHGGAVTGTLVEHRIYLDESGSRLFETQDVRRRGRGYAFPAVWPESDLTLRDPEAAFAASARCPESGERSQR